jgi:cellulose synthase/poly-beta-1,6-N-acetylglucosamine synthase-like glycosyltransferase
MSVLFFALYVFQLLLILFVSVSVVYYFIFAFAGLFRKAFNPPFIPTKRSFCVLIPGFREDKVIINSTIDALQQDYPREKFDVYVIADSFKKETLDTLSKLEAIVFEVSFESSTKAKAINKALSLIKKPYDGVVILDADNLMNYNFLKKMNNAMETGLKAIQGHRIAKNLNSSFAYLDAISEEINNHIFRSGHRAIGMSSALIGSGMAFEYQMFKDYMAQIDSHVEDKELEIMLIGDKVTIEFFDSAYVLDEKVSKSEVFVKQRSRWIANQYIYANRYFFRAVKELFKGNIDFTDKILQYFLPPRIILLGMVYIFFIASVFISQMQFRLPWWILFFVLNVTIAISVPSRFYNRQTLKHLIKLPYGFLLMIVSILNFRAATKAFNPTPKTGNVDQIFNKKKS